MKMRILVRQRKFHRFVAGMAIVALAFFWGSRLIPARADAIGRAQDAVPRRVLVSGTPTATATASATPTATATPTPRVVESIESPANQVPIDGSWTEWPDIPGFTLDASTADNVAGTSPAPSDLSAWVRTMWYFKSNGDPAQSWLYFAVEITDEQVTTDSTDVWQDDGVELGLDVNNDHEDNFLTDHQFTITADNRVADHGAITNTILSATKATSRGYNVEVGIPFALMGFSARPAPGTTIGFTLALNDDDGNNGGNRESYLVWGGPNTNDFAQFHGQLRFVITLSTPTATPTATPTITPTPSNTPTPTATPLTGQITGMVWDDRNANAARDGDETPLSGAIIMLHEQDCLSGGALLVTQVTASDGLYAFADLPPGGYCVRESNPPTYDESTYPDLIFGVPYWSVQVIAEQTTANVDFGDRKSGPTLTNTPAPTPTATPCPRCHLFLPVIVKPAG